MGGWFYARNDTGVQPLITHDDGSYDRSLKIDNRGGEGFKWSAFTGKGVLGGAPIMTGKWTFVVMRHDQSTGKLILDVNGLRVTSKAFFGANLKTTTIGASASKTTYFNGKVDNVFFYKGFLSDEKIADIRQRGQAAILGGSASVASGSPVTPERATAGSDGRSLKESNTANVPEKVSGSETVSTTVSSPAAFPPGTRDVSRPTIDFDQLPGKFVPLFNGTNLTGWQANPPGQVQWQVSEGAIRSTINGGICTALNDYNDFYLRAELKADVNCVGHLLFRFDINSPLNSNYSININTLNKNSVELKTGSLSFFGRNRALDHPIEVIDANLVRPDQWFTLEVVAIGSRFVVRIDKKVIADVVDPARSYARGRIALHRTPNATGNLYCRSIGVKTIDRVTSQKYATKERPLHRYRLRHLTTDIDRAGTDEWVFIHVEGWYGEFHMALDDPHINDRVRGRVDHYDVVGPDIGRIQRIGLEMKHGYGNDPAWSCDWVDVDDLGRGDSYRAKNYGWINEFNRVYWKNTASEKGSGTEKESAVDNAGNGGPVEPTAPAAAKTSASPRSKSGSPRGAVEHNGKHFQVIARRLTWHAAKRECERLGGRLAVVTDDEENRLLTALAQNGGVEGAWLGATDAVSEGRWVWVDGSPMKYQNWDTAAGQPNDKQSREDYLVLLARRGGRWSDQPDELIDGPARERAGFVCEWP